MSGTIDLVGPSTSPGAPQITPAAINTAVNAALATKQDYNAPGVFTTLSSSSTYTLNAPASISHGGSRTWIAGQTSIGNAELWSFTNQSGATASGPAASHYLGIASDTVQSTGVSFANLEVNTNTGANIKGGRNNIWSNLSINGTPADSGQYVAGTFAAQATAPAYAGAGGSIIYGTNPTAGLSAGATGAWQVCGEEIDVRAVTGTAPTMLTGMTIVTVSGHASHGSLNLDSAISIGNQSSVTTGWDYGLRFGGPANPFPFVSSATLIYAYPATSGLTIANGIDFTSLTFTGSAIKSTGFSVDGSGNAVVNGLKLPLLTNAANDAAAAGAGVVVGQFYRNGSVVMQRVA